MTEELQDVEVIEAAVADKKPRGRGRPKKAETIDQIAEETPDVKTPSARKTKKPVDTEDLIRNLQGLHILGAMVTGIPELALSDSEARMLGTSVGRVCEEYGFEISGKTGAAVQLFGAAALVYLPKFIHVRQRAQAARAEYAARMDARSQDEGRTA
jgi:hypothetical protein